MEKTFNDLMFVDAAGYDYIWKSEIKIEKKQLTLGSGLCFAPSKMTGYGRKVNVPEVCNFIRDNNVYFLCVDITQFPIVRVILLPGEYLIDKCTNQRLKFSINQAKRHLFDPYETA